LTNPSHTNLSASTRTIIGATGTVLKGITDRIRTARRAEDRTAVPTIVYPGIQFITNKDPKGDTLRWDTNAFIPAGLLAGGNSGLDTGDTVGIVIPGAAIKSAGAVFIKPESRLEIFRVEHALDGPLGIVLPAEAVAFPDALPFAAHAAHDVFLENDKAPQHDQDEHDVFQGRGGLVSRKKSLRPDWIIILQAG